MKQKGLGALLLVAYVLSWAGGAHNAFAQQSAALQVTNRANTDTVRALEAFADMIRLEALKIARGKGKVNYHTSLRIPEPPDPVDWAPDRGTECVVNCMNGGEGFIECARSCGISADRPVRTTSTESVCKRLRADYKAALAANDFRRRLLLARALVRNNCVNRWTLTAGPVRR